VIRIGGEVYVDEGLLVETDEFDSEVIEIGEEGAESSDGLDSSSKDLSLSEVWFRHNGKVALSVTRLLNNINPIFREQFNDNP